MLGDPKILGQLANRPEGLVAFLGAFRHSLAISRR
jgi:hypothetical protein